MFGARRREPSVMQRQTASHRVFRQMGPLLGDFTPLPRILPVLTRSPSRLARVWCVATLAEWDASVGCLAVSISPNWALDSAISRPCLEDPLFLTRSPSRLACVWCMATIAEWDAAVGCFASSISPNGLSTRRLHATSSNKPCFDTPTVYIGMCLVRGDPC